MQHAGSEHLLYARAWAGRWVHKESERTTASSNSQAQGEAAMQGARTCAVTCLHPALMPPEQEPASRYSGLLPNFPPSAQLPVPGAADHSQGSGLPSDLGLTKDKPGFLRLASHVGAGPLKRGSPVAVRCGFLPGTAASLTACRGHSWVSGSGWKFTMSSAVPARESLRNPRLHLP